MSSTEYATIYDHAAAVVRSECGSISDVNKILSDLRDRALSDERDPLKNRDLIVEPQMDAQILNVSFELYEQVAAHLQRLNILHIWVRVACPSDDDEGLEVIETDSPKDFREAISSPCPHCGQLHDDIEWDNLETFYAFHYNNTPDRFKYSTFFKKLQSLPSATTKLKQPFPVRLREWLQEGPLRRFFQARAPLPADTVAVALETNAPNTVVPSQRETLNTLWVRGSLLLLGGLVTSFFISLWSVTWAILTGAAFFLCFTTLAWVTLNAIYAAAYLERRILTCGYTVAFILLTGSSGIGFGGDATNHPTPKEKNIRSPKSHQENSFLKNVLWDLRWNYGETNSQLAWASVVTFLGTSGIATLLYSIRIKNQ
ncbi:hypothetical protein Pan153_04340 [Gimesia panareensis]|uniref:Uncharacterized protein n=1 Tax=Gimesia panareensis TaxID=2527978 RepID=A0A518FHI6_9PLAN|nr:hypothetical protein [Gimesia panareensis]QDV15815.1 hypothetical protein Pan153_04340 [Gimesia panareensis]